jgi:hypothetical protein
MAVKGLDLFQAYTQNKLPKGGGYIISSFFDEKSPYVKFEIVAYNSLAAIYFSHDGLTFQTDSNKLYIIMEPPDYEHKDEEPFKRTKEKQIPHRFSELSIIQARNRFKIMVSKNPVMGYSSFVVQKPIKDNFSFLFYKLPEVLESVASFLEETFSTEVKIAKEDAKKAVALILQCLNKFTIWNQ